DVREQGRGRGVQRVDQVATVVDDQVRCGVVPSIVQGRLDVAVVALAVDPGAGKNRDAVVDGEGGGDVVLGGQRVGRRQRDRRDACLQQPDQHGGLGGDVQAGGDGEPVKGPVLREPLVQGGQQGHGPFGVADAGVSLGGEPRVGDVSNGRSPACTGRPPARRCSPPAPWSAG